MLRRLSKSSVLKKSICRFHVSTHLAAAKTNKAGSNPFQGMDWANTDINEEIKGATGGQGLPSTEELEQLVESARRFSAGGDHRKVKGQDLDKMMKEANAFMNKLGMNQEEFMKGFLQYQKENIAAKAKAKGVSKTPEDPKANWECHVCTYYANPYNATRCEGCNTPRATEEQLRKPTQDMYVDPSKVDAKTVLKGILGQNIVGKHSAKSARTRRETGEKQPRKDARDGITFNPGDDVAGIDVREIEELRQLVKNYDELKSGKKMTSVEDFRKGLKNLREHLKSIEEMKAETDASRDLTEEEIAKRKKESEEIDAFTAQLEKDIKKLPEPEVIPPRERGIRANRKVRNLIVESEVVEEVHTSQSTTKPSQQQQQQKKK